MKSWHVYMLKCSNDSLYVGVTDNLKRRLSDHKRGFASRFTHDWRPRELIYKEAFQTRREAMAKEKMLKGLTRAKKLALAREILRL